MNEPYYETKTTNTEKKLQLIKLLDEFTQEMDRHSGAYFATIQSPGISAEDYEDVADRILEKFSLKMKGE